MMKCFLLTLLTCSLVFGLPSRSSTTPASLCHPEDQFTCGNGTCIPLEFKCDNVRDCLDGSDEVDCHYLHICPSSTFMCKSGECLSEKMKCNGIPECQDGSDEKACQQLIAEPRSSPISTTPASLCHPEDEFTCGNGVCIPLEHRCDNLHDCLDGSDEVECHYLHTCLPFTFMCKSGECIPGNEKCNGIRDCQDGSDEKSCLHINREPHRSLTKSELANTDANDAMMMSSSREANIWVILFIIFLFFLIAFLILFLMREVYPKFRYRTDLVVDRIIPQNKNTPSKLNNSNSDVAGFRNPTFDNPPLLLNA